MRVLITGASGFLGQQLAASLSVSLTVTSLILTDLTRPQIPASVDLPSESDKIHCVAADLTSPTALKPLFSRPLDAVFLLHGIMSGAAETNLDLGLKVNLYATMEILNTLRSSNPGVTVIYASVLAAYGPSQSNDRITELTAPNPQSSYGSEKVMIETLINDFSRRGLINGRILRLPTIMPRAGAPTGAASSFVSDIIREPLNGRKAVLPVKNKSRKMFVCSPKTIIENFQIAMTIPKERFEKYLSRTLIMPGIVVSSQDILDTLVKVSPMGPEVLTLIEEQTDDGVERIVASWPSDYDFSRAIELGFVRDVGLVENLQDYFERYVKVV